jgi:hypothetical protein
MFHLQSCKGAQSMLRLLFIWIPPISLFLSTFVFSLVASDWEPVDPALLSQKSPLIEKDADVEGIFWDVRVDSASGSQVEVQNYLRLKVFTERGKESVSPVSITYPNGFNIKDIEGRTIKPDGSIVELNKEAIYERTLLSIQRYKLKAKSFALPAVEPGAIVEYRWKEIRPFAYYSRYYLQRDIPVRIISYHIKPPITGFSAATAAFNWPQIAQTKEPHGFIGIQLQNVPAFREEPQMPPVDSIRAFLLVFYATGMRGAPAKFWDDYGKMQYAITKERIKPNDEIKEATAGVIGSSSQPEEVIGKLFQFVRSNIKNINDDASGLTLKQREEALKKRTPANTLKRKTGTSGDIQELFGAMATAAGLEVRMALTGNRADYFFLPSFADPYFISNTIVAIKTGNEWKFYDPSDAYLPMGMLYWGEEGNSALIPDETASAFATTPMSPPEKSLKKRSAKLRLSEDGTIEGDVILEYTGHVGAETKEYNDDESPNAREENLKNMFKVQLSAAEITKIQLENITDRDRPFTYRFHIRVPGYGQRTGKRLFFQPTFFQKGIGPLFTANQRKHNVYFSYPWSEFDDIEITLPAGYDLESPEGHQPIAVGDIAKHEIMIMISDNHQVLRCRRNFLFGGNNRVLFSVKEYPDLKRLFEVINEADSYTLTLKQTTAVP